MGFLDPKPQTTAGLDAAVTAKINTPGSATATALSDTYAQNSSTFPVDIYSGTDTQKALAAIAACRAAGGGDVLFGPRAYTITQPLVFIAGTNFRGAAQTKTKITYAGTAGTWLFDHDVYTANQWPTAVKLSEMTLIGNGTGALGVGATLNGLKSANLPGDAGFANHPFYTLERVRFESFKTGIFLEGYGHHIQETHAYNCETGYELVHPEQVMLLNSWAEYCVDGVRVNGTGRLAYGHKMHILGGAYQRCTTGIRIMNFSQPTIDTYFELNTTADIILGDPLDASNYTKGVKGAEINFYSASGVANGYNIGLFASESTRIRYESEGGANTTKPHVRVNDFCKDTNITYGFITSSVPWNVTGQAVDRTLIAPMVDKGTALTALNAFTPDAGNPPTMVRTSGGDVRIRGAVNVNTMVGATIAQLPAGHYPPLGMYFSAAAYSTQWNAAATVKVETTGAITLQSGANGNILFLDQIRFTPKASF